MIPESVSNHGYFHQTSFRNAHMQCIVPPRTRAPDASCPIVNLLNVYILRLIWVENGRHSSARLSGLWRHRKFKPRSNPLNLGSFSSTREKNIPASVGGYRYRVIHIVSLFNVWWAQPPVKSAFSHLVKGYLSCVWQQEGKWTNNCNLKPNDPEMFHCPGD